MKLCSLSPLMRLHLAHGMILVTPENITDKLVFTWVHLCFQNTGQLVLIYQHEMMTCQMNICMGGAHNPAHLFLRVQIGWTSQKKWSREVELAESWAHDVIHTDLDWMKRPTSTFSIQVTTTHLSIGIIWQSMIMFSYIQKVASPIYIFVKERFILNVL